jgi:Acetyltransferase (GNAT) domain
LLAACRAICGQKNKESGRDKKGMNYTVEIDRISETDWSRNLEKFADANVYQAWAYGSVRWGTRNLSHLILKRGDEVVGMAQLRLIQPAGLRMGIAYLRWGPLCHLRGSELNLEVLEALAEALREEYCRQRGLYLEVLPNAFGGTERAEAFQLAFSSYDNEHRFSSAHYRTIVVDIQPSLEDVRKKFDRKWRNQLSASERNNLTVTFGTSSEDYARFSALYTEMWERKKFKTTVSVPEFGQIQQSLPENEKMRVALCYSEGKPAAGVVCTALGDSGIYILGATNEVAMKVKAAYFLHWNVIQWLKEVGVRYYDLGGIDPEGNPGVYSFKSGFSGTDVSHINSMTVCDSRVSMALIKTGHALRDSWNSVRARQG